MDFKIIKAEEKHIEEIGILFDLYRQFYKYKGDDKKSIEFISKRIINKESTIFVCIQNNKLLGFTQLYETFDSLNLNKKIILYDLYVLIDYRQTGIAKSLMNKAKEFAENNNYGLIELSTAITNTKAQSLYESLNYKKDTEFINYYLEINKN